jgi:hypothetical protein
LLRASSGSPLHVFHILQRVLRGLL